MATCTPPTLTFNEIIAARQAGVYSKYMLTDGRGNFSPESAVAIKRGAKFTNFGPFRQRDMDMVSKAMSDLATYLGFSNVNDYADALQLEGFNIFRRVNNGNI